MKIYELHLIVESDSRCSTPIDMVEDDEKPKPQVLDLASAILQVSLIEFI